MDKTGPDRPMADVPGRGTVQRGALLDVLRATGRFRTAQDIFSELRSKGERIGLTTVYRGLQRLVEKGVVHAVQTSDRQTAYRLCSDEAHHHLVCTRCGDGVEITDTSIDGWVGSQATQRGYTEVAHRVEIFGVCPSCASSSAENAGLHSATQGTPDTESANLEGSTEQ